MKIIESFAFVVEGEPKGQPRQRSFLLRGKGGQPIIGANGQPVVRTYDPSTAEGWKSQIALAARPFNKGEPIDCPLSLSCVFHFARPKSHFGTGRNSGILKDSAPRYHTGKPDMDNVIKALKDALTGIRLWRDDSLVVRYGYMEKCWAERDYTHISIEYAGATA